MKKFLKCTLFSAFVAVLAVGFTGCYGEDIDDLKQDVEDIKNGLSDQVISVRAEIVRLEGLIAILNQAIDNQNDRITDLENSLDLDDPNSAISIAIANGDLATLNAAKAYADSLYNALKSQIDTINGFLGLDTSGQLIVNEASPNNMLNGTYATLNDFIRSLTVYLSSLKGMIDANAANIGALQDAIDDVIAELGTADSFWADDLNINTVWAAIGYNYGEITGILNRINNLGGVDGRTLESFVEDVDAFIADMNAFVDEINGRFDGFADGETIIDMIEKFVGDLTSTDGTEYPDATSMINGEIEKLDTKLTTYINGQISDLRDELMDYIDEQLALLKEELLGKMQDMVTGLMLVNGTDATDPQNPIIYDGNIGYDVIKEVETTTFGPNDEITFTEGNIVLSTDPGPQPVLVKVTPDHADISGATFVLFDSDKKDYIEEGIFTYTVARYSGGVLTRAVPENGLWVVTLTIADGNDFPVGGVLLSLGIVNNMADPASTDRIVSTGPVIDASTSVADYNPWYYTSSSAVWIVNTVGIGSRNIYSVANSGPNQIWDPVPSVDPLTGDYTPGTAVSGDDRSTRAVDILTMTSPDSVFHVRTGAPPFDGFMSWYVDFKDGVPPASTTESDWGDINVLFYPNSGVLADFTVPVNNALHRELVEFNVHGVNLDGTLVDPDGVPFTIGVVAPDYRTSTSRDFTVTLDNNYGPGDYDGLFDTDAIAFNVNTLGFTADFIAGLTASYEIVLADPGLVIGWDETNGQAPNPHTGDVIDGITITNTDLGVMQTTANGTTWTDVSAATDWPTVVGIRFRDVDPKAMELGVAYTGELVLTEDPASTVANMANYVDEAAYPAAEITYPISITLGGNLTFDTTMMNYKPGFGPSQITIWPVGSGAGSASIFNFEDAFTNIPSANIVFEYLGTNTGDITTVNDPAVPENYLSIANVELYASTPGQTVVEGPIEASYTYGPVWETAYGDGNMLAPWSENPIGIEIRRYLDWYTLSTNDDPIVISLSSPTLSASTFFFATQDPGRTDITLGGNMTFDGNQRIAGTITVTLSDSSYFTIDDFDPYGGNDNFGFSNISSVSLNDPVDITMTISYTDDFGTVFTTAPFNVRITN